MNKITTSNEYAKYSGTRCPACNSEDIEGSLVEIDGAGASQDIRCNSCYSTWIDVHVLVGYEDLEVVGKGR